MATKVEFKRVQTDAEVENIDIKDGQLIYTGTGKTYMDYGNERIPTGSGGGSEVVIDDEQPTGDDWKIWIDTGEVESAASEITNEYSTSTGLGYSANYVNNLKKVVWTNPNPTSAIGETTITIDDISNYDSYEIIYKTYRESNILNSTGIIPKGNSLSLNVNEVNVNANVSSLNTRIVDYVSSTSLKVNYGIVQNINTNGTITINSNTSTTNSICVPIYVIAHNTGLFN